MKNLNMFLGLTVLAILISVLSPVTASAQTIDKLTYRECNMVFPWADDIQFLQTKGGDSYCTAWFRGLGGGEDVPEFFGYVFVRDIFVEGEQIKLLVGLKPDGRIAKLKVFGAYPVSTEFLSEFKGRSLTDGVEIASGHEDLLYIPSKIRAIHGEVELSRKISAAVKQVLISASDMPKQAE